MATISRLLKITGLFCKRALSKRHILQQRPLILSSLLRVRMSTMGGFGGPKKCLNRGNGDPEPTSESSGRTGASPSA